MEFNVTHTRLRTCLPGTRWVRYLQMDMLMPVPLDLQVQALLVEAGVEWGVCKSRCTVQSTEREPPVKFF